MRVQSDHWAIIVEFCEQHPQIITNKFSGLGGRNALTDLWKKLTIKLNALGFGEKTVDGWKKTITDWKSKTKAKAGNIKTHIRKTGGGMQCNLTLTCFEERLLMIMGKTSYEGNAENVERGIRKRKLFDENVNEQAGNTELVPVHYNTDHTYTYIQDTMTHNDDIIIDSEPLNQAIYTTDKVIPNLLTTQSTVHFTSTPSSSTSQVFIPSKTKDSINLNNISTNVSSVHIPSTYLSKDIPTIHFSYVPSSVAPQLTPSKTKDYAHKVNIAPVHAVEEITPRKSNLQNSVGKKDSERRKIGNKKDGSQNLQQMHNELLGELKNINININSIAESLKIIAISLNK